MEEPMKFPVSVPTLRVRQPLGEFYVAKLSAAVLLQVTYSDPLRLLDTAPSKSTYSLRGSQREESLKKLREIGGFINTTEAAFPNSIILAANFNQNGELEEDINLQWRIDDGGDEGCDQLIIPTEKALASIIDGQHRLHGFEYAHSSKLEMELLCAIYLDLPNPYQAYLFATINFNQKKVDRSLAYELFGFNVEEEPPHSWAPDKMAVFLCRKLNTEKSSPFYQHIIVAAQNDRILFQNKPQNVAWAISTATIVDGILKLVSANPKRDRDLMHQKTIEEGRSRKILEDDDTPLRELYLDTNDLAIYTIVKNFFGAVDQLFWSHANDRSYIMKTVGIQALFEVLRLLLKKGFRGNKKASVEYFAETLGRASKVDFSHEYFQASGLGKNRIRNTIGFASGLIDESKFSVGDIQRFRELTNI